MTTKHKPKLYKGICETIINHKKSFNVEKNKSDTKLSTECWKLANNKLHPWISWRIKGNNKSYNLNSKRCGLCLDEKLETVDDPKEILNKCSEVISQCCHQNKYKLKTLLSNKQDQDITYYTSSLLQVYRKYMLWRFSKFLEVLRGGVYP